jgi:hypothetical protein
MWIIHPALRPRVSKGILVIRQGKLLKKPNAVKRERKQLAKSLRLKILLIMRLTLSFDTSDELGTQCITSQGGQVMAVSMIPGKKLQTLILKPP